MSIFKSKFPAFSPSGLGPPAPPGAGADGGVLSKDWESTALFFCLLETTPRSPTLAAAPLTPRSAPRPAAAPAATPTPRPAPRLGTARGGTVATGALLIDRLEDVPDGLSWVCGVLNKDLEATALFLEITSPATVDL